MKSRRVRKGRRDHDGDKSTLVEFRDVALGYGRKQVFSRLSFGVRRGDFLGIVGPNGSGKTTLLRALLGILRPRAGSIVVQSPEGRTVRMGYVPQRETLDPILPYTVHDVVLMGRFGSLGPVRWPKGADRTKVHEVLSQVDLADLETHSFRDLSGGQKQRALIARALAAEAELLVLDEPTNGMDLGSRVSIMDLIRRLHDERGLTIIMVSHLLSDVAHHVKRIALVEKGVFQIGAVADILSERNLSGVYGIPVHVGTFRGTKVIVAGGHS
jgi:ABC-type Mn2+/Zn2+ transport system ATPase subunit